jgi:hypothetical protein
VKPDLLHLIPEDSFIPFCGYGDDEPVTASGPPLREPVRLTGFRDEASCSVCVAMHDALEALCAAKYDEEADALLADRVGLRGSVLPGVVLAIDAVASYLTERPRIEFIQADSPIERHLAALAGLAALLLQLRAEAPPAPAPEGSTR